MQTATVASLLQCWPNQAVLAGEVVGDDVGAMQILDEFVHGTLPDFWGELIPNGIRFHRKRPNGVLNVVL